MLRMRQSIHQAIIILFFILHFETLQLEGSPFNSRRTRKHGNAEQKSTTLSWDEVMGEIFVTEATASKSTTPFTPMATKTQAVPPTVKVRHETKVNVSEVFYFKEKVDGYPDLAQIEHLLRKFNYLFDNDKADAGELGSKTLNEKNPEQYIHLCGNQELNIPLAQEVKNTQGEKILLVNYDKYEQTIRGEICGYEKKKQFQDTPCGNYLQHYHEGYQPMCKQNWIHRKVVVMKKSPDEADNLIVAEDEIPIPACCECVLKDNSMT